EQLESWGRELLAAGGPGSAGAISPLFRSSYLERPTLLVLQPIQDRFNHTNGYLVERLDLRELEAMLTPLQDADLAPSFWLLDGDGNLLARAGRLVTDPGHDTFLQDPAAKLNAGAITEAEVRGLGRGVFGVRALSGAFPGQLVAALPAAVAYQPLA